MLYQQYFIEWKSSGILWRKRSVKNSFGPELAHSPHLCGVKLCYVRRYRFTTPTEQCLLILESHHHKRTNTHTEYTPPHPRTTHRWLIISSSQGGRSHPTAGVSPPYRSSVNQSPCVVPLSPAATATATSGNVVVGGRGEAGWLGPSSARTEIKWMRWHPVVENSPGYNRFLGCFFFFFSPMRVWTYCKHRLCKSDPSNWPTTDKKKPWSRQRSWGGSKQCVLCSTWGTIAAEAMRLSQHDWFDWTS